MNVHRQDLALITVLIGAVGFASVRAWPTAELPAMTLTSSNGQPAARRTLAADDGSVDALIERDPFRIDHGRGSGLPPESDAEQDKVTATLRTPVPRVSVSAIIGGPPWQAVLSGVPGQSGAVLVTEGARYDAMFIARVGRDTVVVQFPDTTLRLTIRREGP